MTSRAETRQRLGEQPRPAADVDEVDAGERRALRRFQLEMPDDRVARPADPNRVQAMQRRHRPVGVPPVVAQRVETRDLLRRGSTTLGDRPRLDDRSDALALWTPRR